MSSLVNLKKHKGQPGIAWAAVDGGSPSPPPDTGESLFDQTAGELLGLGKTLGITNNYFLSYPAYESLELLNGQLLVGEFEYREKPSAFVGKVEGESKRMVIPIHSVLLAYLHEVEEEATNDMATSE